MLEQISNIFREWCDFISQILAEDYSQNQKERSVQIVEFYNTCWRTYSAALQKLDEELSGVSSVVNSVYSGVEKDDDKDDTPFSFLKLGNILWRYRVYKKN